MSYRITRRQVLAAGAVTTSALLGKIGTPSAREQSGRIPGRVKFWEPGPNKDLVRDLTPGKTPVRLAGYLGYDEKIGIGETVKKLRDSGLSAAIAGVEPWYSMNDSVIRELREALRQHDVVIFEVGGYRNIITPDESLRKENFHHLAQCLETAEKIGCRMVGTISGSRDPAGKEYPDHYNVHPDNWTLETWNLLIDGIKQILRDTSGLKAVLGMEAQVTTNIDSPLAHRRLMDDIGDERVKVNFDPTNMVSLHNYFHTTELINDCFDLLGEDIFGCHAKDTYILPHQQTVHVQEVCPGRGVMDYEMYLVRLSRMKWPRSLLPEHFPQEQYDEAYAYIRKVAEKVGVKMY